MSCLTVGFEGRDASLQQVVHLGEAVFDHRVKAPKTDIRLVGTL